MDQIFSEFSKDAVRAPKGTVLMRQGEIGRSAYFVIQGRLLVEREINGEIIAVAEIGARDIVGEMAILDDSPRSATVTVIEDAMLVLLDKNRIKQIIRRSPTVAELILKLLCYKLRTAHQAIQNLSNLENPEFWLKIAKTLLLCYRANPEPKELYKTFCNHVEEVLGLSNERTTELVNRLNYAKLIHLDDKKIHKVDETRVKIFLWLGHEDFANEELKKPSEIKVYHAVETILRAFGTVYETQETAMIQKEQLLNFLISANLWEHLRPALQNQRANLTINQLIHNNFLVYHAETDKIEVIFQHLLTLKPPKDLINTYKEMRKTLFQQSS